MDPENDTGILVTWLSHTIEESRRLRENLKQSAPAANGPVDGVPPAEDAPSVITSSDPPSQPG